MRLKELREERNLSQLDVANAIGTSQTNIGRWEKERNEPSSGYVIKLADFFEVTTDYLLGREDDFGNISVTTNSDLTASLTFSSISALGFLRSLRPNAILS